MLALLLRHPAQPVSKEEIIRQAWPRHQTVSDESIVRCISQLRRRVPQARIETLYGFGYQLLLPAGPRMHEPLLQATQAPADLVELFMHARTLLQGRTATSLAQAIELLRKLTDRQADYMSARILLARAISLAHQLDLNTRAGAALGEAWEQVRTVQRMAPNSPVLAATLAGLCDTDWRFAEARALHQEALRKLPGLPCALQPYIWHLVATGQAARALEHQQRILAQRPYAPLEHITWAQLLACAGEQEAALQAMEAVRAAHPGHPLVVSAWCGLRAMLAPHRDLIDVAQALREKEELPSFAQVSYPYVLARCGQKARARRALDAALGAQRTLSPHRRMALVPAMIELGEFESAADEVRAAHRARYSWLPGKLHSPRYAALRQHPRVREIFQEFSWPENRPGHPI